MYGGGPFLNRKRKRGRVYLLCQSGGESKKKTSLPVGLKKDGQDPLLLRRKGIYTY